MPDPKVTDPELLGRLLLVFRTVGYEGASLSKLSEATGLKRASLYHRFPGGKEEMAGKVLTFVDEWIEENVVQTLAAGGKPRQRVQAMCKNLEGLYRRGSLPCLLGSLSLGAGGDLFQEGIGKSMGRWSQAMAKVAAEAGDTKTVARQRGEDALVRIQGALVVARATGSNQPFLRVLRDLPAWLVA